LSSMEDVLCSGQTRDPRASCKRNPSKEN
jgi:hypothetical protein